jgi:phage portal protein BeeE
VFQFGGNSYGYGYGNTGVNINQSWMSQKVAEVTNDLPGYMAALRGCPPAFAAQMVRANVLSQVRFTFRNPPWHPRTPRRTFGTAALGPLERPWTNATTGELVGRMEWHEGLTGNAYVHRQPNRLRILRPDWVAVVYGSDQEPEDAAHALDGDLLGYVYQNGGIGRSTNKPQTLLPTDVAHWCPNPDPECAGIGMSWLTPAIRDIQADRLATTHKIRYFEHGATPNLVVKGITAATKEQFDQIVEMLDQKHSGVANAYRTLYLTAGADATVVGSNLAELDLKNVQGASETRISMLSRVHPTILAVAEGLAGSSLNAGNFGMARRIWADSWIYPTLQDLAGSMAPLVRVPSDAELWFDTTDMPILREDAKDAAEIVQIKISSIVSAINGGLDPDSAIAAVDGGDVKLLKHTGMVSVQLQPPGSEPTPAAAPARELELDDEERADRNELKRYWLHGEGLAKWAPSPHPWTSLYGHLKDHMPDGMAKRVAAEWFHEHFGFWPGSDLNRVTHGKPPKGNKVGPG